MNCDLDTPIPEWIIEYPESEIVFNKLGIDVSCGGKSLQYLCYQNGLNPQHVISEVIKAVSQGRNNDGGTTDEFA